MMERPVQATEAGRARAMARKVYCAARAPLRLADGTPVHLEWMIEGSDGELYRVPSEPGGWLRRTPYKGQLDRLRLVSTEKARTILWVTYADTDGADVADPSSSAPPGEYPLEHWAY